MIDIVPARLRRLKVYRFIRWMVIDSWPYLRWNQLLNPSSLLLCWRVCGYTQQNMAGLLNVCALAARVDSGKRRGAFVECGVWRGGCAGVMGLLAKAGGRRLWLFDSFAGMPERSERDIGREAEDLANGATATGTNVASLEDVQELLYRKLRLNREAVEIRKGWFHETIEPAKREIGPIAILRIDADWYESTRTCLDILYENVVDGGFVIVDDYGWFPGCRAAVDEFLACGRHSVELCIVDYTRVYFEKPATQI